MPLPETPVVPGVETITDELRPTLETLPAELWGEDGKLKVDGLLGQVGTWRQADEARRQGWENERLAKRPPAADKYEIGDLGALMPADFDKSSLNDDALLGWWREKCFEQGLDHAAYTEGVTKFIEHIRQLDRIDETAERESLGEHAEARFEAVSRYVDSRVPTELRPLAKVLGSTADGVRLLEWIREQATGKPVNDGAGGGNAADGKAALQSQIDGLMNQSDYFRRPDLQKQVDVLYHKMLPGKLTVGPSGAVAAKG